MVRKNWPILCILVCAAVLKFLYIISLKSNPLPFLAIINDTFDQSRFFGLALKILEFGWMNTGVTWFSPTYSIFLAGVFKVFGKSITNVFFVQSAVGLLGVYIFYRCAWLLFDNKNVGYICAVIAAGYGVFTFYEGALMRACLITNLNLFTFYFLLKALKEHKLFNFALSGVCLACSYLLRPNALLIFILIYIGIVIKNRLKDKIKVILIFTAAFLITIAPMTIRNYVLSKNINISSQGASTFWIGNTYDSSGIGLWRSPLRGQFAAEAGGNFIKTIKILKREIALHPQEYAALYGRKIMMFFNGYEIPANISFDHFKEEHPILNIAFLKFSLICPFALIGFLMSYRKFSYLGLAHMFFGILSFSVILFHIQSRYRLAAMPFFILFAAYGAYYLFMLIKERRIISLIVFILTFAIFSLHTVPNEYMIKKYFGNPIRSADYANMAVAYHARYKYKHDLSDQEKEFVLRKIVENFQKAREVNFGRNEEFIVNCWIDESVFLIALEESQLAHEKMEQAISSGFDREYIYSQVKYRSQALKDNTKRYEYFPQLSR